MELRQLEYLVTVAEEQSFTRAAEKLLVSQPGISAQIRRLERELGQELLDRSGRSVRLTAVGEAVLPAARAALDAVDGIQLAVSELTGLLRGRASLGVVTSPNLDLAAILAEFHHRHPLVDISLSAGTTDELASLVRSGQLDLAVLSIGAVVPDGLAIQVIDDQPIVAAVSHDHELALMRRGQRRTGPLPVRELQGLPLISLPAGTGLRSRLDEACAAAGFRPVIAFEASSPEVLADLAARGLGVALLPGVFAEFRADRLTVIRLGPPGLRGRLVLAWRANGPGSPAGRALVRLTRDFVRPGSDALTAAPQVGDGDAEFR
jgi:DNA-binding transcriptional LysR family regulator